MRTPFLLTHPGRGLCGWCVVTFGWWQPSPDERRWIMPLLFFSALFLMPFSQVLQRRSLEKLERNTNLEVVCAFLLVVSFIQDRVIWAVALTLPWLFFRVWWAAGSVRILRQSQAGLDRLLIASAGLFPVVGAAWLTLHQSRLSLLGFDPLIVMLTAAHFHHAGFTLPLMAGLNAQASPDRWTRFSCVAILLGVPLVALGITGAHFGVFRFVEPVGVAVLVLGALGVAGSQVRRGLEPQLKILTRMGFLVSGGSLVIAMLLALGFGVRYLIPNFALTMPQMWAIHGTLNAFGFGLCGILAWRSALTRSASPSADQTA